MNKARNETIILLFLILPLIVFSRDTLRLSRSECEALFLQKNLLVVAEKMNISQAEAIKIQAKLWPNPTFEISDINLWATQSQLAVFGDELQGFGGGNFGKNQQIGMALEQLILTAGKRKKLVALETVGIEKAEENFEEFLRNLRLEFRHQLTNLQFLQLQVSIYKNQLNSITSLTEAFQRQSDLKYIPKSEYIRLKAVELEISKSVNNIYKNINEAQKEIKNLIHIPSSTFLEINEKDFIKNIDNIYQLSIEELTEIAKKSRPDFQLARLDHKYYNKLYTYELAQKVPDLRLKATYDRGGSFVYNFIGFGVVADIPLFNRNQGNIHLAQIGIEQSKTILEYKELSLQNEIILARQNLVLASNFYQDIDPSYEATLDGLLEGFTRNLTTRNISLVEYIDFLEAYLENKNIILESRKELNEMAEEFNYTIGRDIF